MPAIDWGISRGTLTNYERPKFNPYDGELPPNRVYRWLIKKIQYAAATDQRAPQLILGLELVPRKGRNDSQYAGFYVQTYNVITDKSVSFWGPILDALGVSEAAFRAAKIDTEGNIRSMGKWRNDGKQYIMGLLKDNTYNGVTTKQIGWWGPDSGEGTEPEEEEEYDDEEYDDEDYESEEEEEDSEEDDWDDEEEEEEPAPRKRRARR